MDQQAHPALRRSRLLGIDPPHYARDGSALLALAPVTSLRGVRHLLQSGWRVRAVMHAGEARKKQISVQECGCSTSPSLMSGIERTADAKSAKARRALHRQRGE
jgi:hypothetical protein